MSQEQYDDWNCDEWVCSCGMINTTTFCLACGKDRPPLQNDEHKGVDKDRQIVASYEIPNEHTFYLTNYEQSAKAPYKKPTHDVDVDGRVYKCSSREEAAYLLKQRTAERFFDNSLLSNSFFGDWLKY